MNKNIKYTLGLDLGIASVGWAAIGLDEQNAPTHIIETGVVVVESMEDDKGNLKNADRRAERGSRRTIRRKQNRVKRIKNLCHNHLEINSLDEAYQNIRENVYSLKVRGLKEELSSEELAIVLVHYAKHRGFKSNRKEETSGDDGAILKAIEKNKERLAGRHISELIYQELDGINKVKNSEEYKYSFTREQFEKEISALLDKQIECNVIDKNFKDQYLKLWASQRDFSEGPGGDSKYKVDFAKVFGYCTFDKEELRAPHKSPSQELNMMLGKLLNIRYRHLGELEYKALTPEEIQQIVNNTNQKEKSTYKAIINVIDKKAIIEFKGKRVSKKVYGELKRANPDLNDDEFRIVLLKKIYDDVLYKLKGTTAISKVFIKEVGIDLFEELYYNNIEYLDDIATALTFYKTDERISNYFRGIETEKKQAISGLNWDLYPEIVENVIPKISSQPFTEAGALSLKILHQLNKKMYDGVPYDQAMTEIGFSHSISERKAIKMDKLGPIPEILDTQYPNEISNPRVIRVLTRTGSLINSCIDKHGMPTFINIEVARDINLKRGKRAILENDQLNNLTDNERIKAQILQTYPNKSYASISKYDVEKYKLFYEQEGICTYSLQKMEEGNILSEDYEVDHIIPYSKSKMNSLQNKTLVYKKYNQEKKDMVPVEYFRKFHPDKLDAYKQQIAKLYRVNDNKKELYLIPSLADVPEGMGEASINDTRFITKYLTEILENNLKFPETDKVKHVIPLKAGYVKTYKDALQISRFTHSFESSDYKKKSNFVVKEIGIRLNEKNKDHPYKIIMITNDLINNTEITKEIVFVKETDKTPIFLLEQNRALINVAQNAEKIDFSIFIGKKLVSNKILDNYGQKYKEEDIFDEVSELNLPKELSDDLEKLLTLLKAEVNKEQIKKNRTNHLHHALDAVAVGLLSISEQQKIAKYEVKKNKFIDSLKEGPKTLTVHNETKVIETPDDFKDFEYAYLREHFPVPFTNLENEVKGFIYEFDPEKQKAMLEDEKYRIIKPLIPVQTKKRRYQIKGNDIRVGGLHKETIYGISSDQEHLLKRISVKDLDRKKLEKLYGKNTFATETYLACAEWLDRKKDTEYPTLKTGRLIKKVKIIDGEAKKALDVRRGYAAVDLTVRIDVYKKENEDRLYFLQQNNLSIVKDLKGDEFTQTLWYGRDTNKIELSNKKIKDEYQKVCELHPGDLVEVTLKKGYQGLVYVNGFSSGKLEVKDLIGDNYWAAHIFKVKKEQNQIQFTISTIEKIHKKKINIRGEIKQ